MPGRYYPAAEPVEPRDADRLDQPLGEVDTDPSNNPGRPQDAFDYIGMRPKATWALAHPSLDGGSSGGDSGGGEGSSGAGDESGSGEEPSGEPTEKA